MPEIDRHAKQPLVYFATLPSHNLQSAHKTMASALAIATKPITPVIRSFGHACSSQHAIGATQSPKAPNPPVFEDT